jgi:hypothetical protein
MPWSARILGVCGVLLIGIGAYFVVGRPPFLPEDARYAGATLKDLQTVAPKLGEWLGLVFWVLGGFIAGTGILTVYVSVTAFRFRTPGAGALVALAGIASLGSMAVVNVLIDSAFTLPLVALAALWASAVVLHGRGK